jgi:hypothetical protein
MRVHYQGSDLRGMTLLKVFLRVTAIRSFGTQGNVHPMKQYHISDTSNFLAGWSLEPIWTIWRKEIYAALSGNEPSL